MKIIFVPCLPKMVGRRYSFPSTLARMGHEVYSITWEAPSNLSPIDTLKQFSKSFKTEKYDCDDFTICKFSRLPYFWPYVNGILFRYQLNNLFKTIGADVVISQSYTNETTTPKNLPLIYDMSDDQVAMAELYGSLVYRMAFRLLGVRSVIKRQCRNARAVIAVSKRTKALAEQHNRNVYEIPNGFNRNLVQKVKKRNPNNLINPQSLIYISAFNQWSKPIETIDCVIALKKGFPNLELTLIGDGTKSGEIERTIANKRVESYIHYLGPIYDQEEVYKAINAHAIGLNISEKNKFRDAASPVKIFEYTGFDKKVVSTDLAEVTRLALPNVHIFRYRNSASIKKAIEVSLTDVHDYSHVSCQVLNEYSWENLTQKLHKVIVGTIAA